MYSKQGSVELNVKAYMTYDTQERPTRAWAWTLAWKWSSQVSTWCPGMDTRCSCEHLIQRTVLIFQETFLPTIGTHVQHAFIFTCSLQKHLKPNVLCALKYIDHKTPYPGYFLRALFGFDMGAQQYLPFCCSQLYCVKLIIILLYNFLLIFAPYTKLTSSDWSFEVMRCE